MIKSFTPQSIDTLVFDGATFSYDGGKPVFDRMTFEVPMGKNILITGPAGNGQSTFLKMLCCLVQPQSGSFRINGEDTTDMGFEEFLPFRRKIAYTFDLGGLFANRTLLDNLTLPLMYHKTCLPEQADQMARGFAKEFSFEPQLLHRPASVSGGLRKLVTVLRAFMMKPEMIVMDDPFTGVDPSSVRKLISMIHSRREIGELRHLFFTSRDEVWPQRLGYEPIVIQAGVPRHDPNPVGPVSDPQPKAEQINVKAGAA